MTFILIQGSLTSYSQIKTNWLPKLQAELEPLGHKIVLPQLPFDEWKMVTKNGPTAATRQSLVAWTKAFEEQCAEILAATNKDVVFVAHSLGPLFVLHLLTKYKIRLDSAIFVCPFLHKLEKSAWQINQVNSSFYEGKFNFSELKNQIPLSYVLYGTNDPYVETNQSLELAAQLQSSVIPVVAGGHLSKETHADLIVELCKTRVSLISD